MLNWKELSVVKREKEHLVGFVEAASYKLLGLKVTRASNNDEDLLVGRLVRKLF